MIAPTFDGAVFHTGTALRSCANMGPRGWNRMTRRDNNFTQASGNTTTTDASGATTADAMEQRIVAFAEQLGRMAGTVQAKAEGWMDRDTLYRQIASIRDGAAELLEHLSADSSKESKSRWASTKAPKGSIGRSGGIVDAPGKKHRKPLATDPRATIANSQAAKMRTAKTMVKTSRRRGRG
jgi:hypothetical protein